MTYVAPLTFLSPLSNPLPICRNPLFHPLVEGYLLPRHSLLSISCSSLPAGGKKISMSLGHPCGRRPGHNCIIMSLIHLQSSSEHDSLVCFHPVHSPSPSSSYYFILFKCHNHHNCFYRDVSADPRKLKIFVHIDGMYHSI